LCQGGAREGREGKQREGGATADAGHGSDFLRDGKRG